MKLQLRLWNPLVWAHWELFDVTHYLNRSVTWISVGPFTLAIDRRK